MSQGWKEILYKVEDRVATVTLNRPEKLNAWTVVMAGELREALAKAEADEGVRAIVITGAGRGFCAGADMSRLAAAAAGSSTLGAPPMPTEGLEANFAQRLSYMLAVKKPILAAINGPVAGVGLVVTFYCDMRFMAAGTKLTTAFARRGLVAEHGIAWLLPRLIGPMNALDLLYTARSVEAEEAEKMGLVRVLPAEGFRRGRAGPCRRHRQPLLAALHAHHQEASLRGHVPVAGGGERDRQPRAGDLPRHGGLPRGRRALPREAQAELHRAVIA